MSQTVIKDNETGEAVTLSNDTQETACIMAFTRDVRDKQYRRGDDSVIDCISYFRCSRCKTWVYKGKCHVSCGHWHSLKFTDAENTDLRNNEKNASINLIDHLQELVPHHTKGKIGLVTYQNGINNDYDRDFSGMGKRVRFHLEEAPLCIGLYNQTSTIAADLCRMQLEFFGVRTEIIRTMRKMFNTLSNRLKKNQPHPHWLHIAHSEGGLISTDTLKGLSYEASTFCKNHLIVHTYGAVHPVPETVAKEALNFYATHDIAYNQYGTRFENRGHYTIKPVDSLEKPYFPIPGDHSFLGKTYSGVLKDNMDNIRKSTSYGIYGTKS